MEYLLVLAVVLSNKCKFVVKLPGVSCVHVARGVGLWKEAVVLTQYSRSHNGLLHDDRGRGLCVTSFAFKKT